VIKSLELCSPSRVVSLYNTDIQVIGGVEPLNEDQDKLRAWETYSHTSPSLTIDY
jgi:hypothetical protein